MSADLQHALVIGPGLDVRLALLLFEEGETTIGLHCFGGVFHQGVEIADGHGGGGRREVRHVREKRVAIGAGDLQSAPDGVEVSRGGVTLGQCVGQLRGTFGDERAGHCVARLAAGHAGVCHEFAFGDGELGTFGGGERIDVADDGDDAGIDDGPFALESGEFGAGIGESQCAKGSERGAGGLIGGLHRAPSRVVVVVVDVLRTDVRIVRVGCVADAWR